MKHFALLSILILSVTSMVVAADYDKQKGSVDKEKAAGFDTEQLKESVNDNEVDYKKSASSVDKEQAEDSVDVDKAKEAMTDDYGY